MQLRCSMTQLVLGFLMLCATQSVFADSQALESLKRFLGQPLAERGNIAEQSFATAALTKDEAAKAKQLLWDDRVAHLRESRAAEMKAGTLTEGDKKMPFAYRVFGDKPKTGRSLYISMHGGGGAPKRVNDQQWENQKRLYQPPEGVYVAPRAPTDNWNLWHEAHIDPLFDRLIENMVVFEDVDPNRVYLMGYSAGGDGAYQLGPRMADRWAAVSMMAGHPNDASPLGLRNIGFAIFMGGRDAAYDRNKIAGQWREKLAELRAADPEGYLHEVTIYPNKGHWMDREDAVSIDWMRKQTRNLLPQKIVWQQDDVTHRRFYWLAVENPQPKALLQATRDGQSIDLSSSDVNQVVVRLCDDMLDLDQPIRVTSGEGVLFEGQVERTIATLAKTLAERGDPQGMFAAEVPVSW